MNDASWIRLSTQDPAFVLPADLAAADPLGARDCGWVEQMRPFIRQFSKLGERVFDPFCGFGTTLLAAHLEGRRGAGCDVDTARVALSRQRLARHGATSTDVSEGSLDVIATGEFDLCLTNVPYFGCTWSGEARPGQLYAEADYRTYLDQLRSVFHAVRERLAPDRYCIAMAENIRVGPHSVPLAFDVARVLDGLFTRCEEKVIVYDQPTRDLAPFDAASNRSHEYALVYRKSRERIDLAATDAVLTAMASDGIDFSLHGSFVRWREEEIGEPSDADILVAPNDASLNAALSWLRDRGFMLTCWGEPISLPVSLSALSARWYVHARRVDGSGSLIRLDVGWRHSTG